MNTKLSIFIITYNEEKIIAKCLEKLTWADEIVVVDSGSTDATLNICKKYNAKIFHKDFNGFGEQKQYALEQTTNNWVLSLDADEVLTDGLISEIQNLLNNTSPKYLAYNLNRRHFFLGKIFKYGKLSKEPVLRLFTKSNAKFSEDKVHEKVLVNCSVGRLKGHFLHYTVFSIEDVKQKEDKYTSIAAKRNFEKNKKVNYFKYIFTYPFTFFKEFILRLNFLNGYQGFVWSKSNARSSKMKIEKLKKLYSKNT